MHPVLFRIGPVVVKSYGVLLALSFGIGLLLSLARAKRGKIKPEIILDLFLVVLISSIIGSRFFYMIFHLEEFQGRFFDMVNPIQSSGEIGIGGLSMVGGVVLAIISGMIFLYFKKLNIWRIADLVSPTFPLGLAITRVGCFLNGCCFGKPTSSGCGVVFPSDSFAGYLFPNTPLYPTQLFSSFLGGLIFVILILAERRKTFDGFTFFLMLMLYSIDRFIIDFFRYYEESMVFLHWGKIDISMNQAVLVLVSLFSLFMWNFLNKRAKKINGV
jgi:phosphatidylglycerol:prolipoprotein diacylglycerol transferase